MNLTEYGTGVDLRSVELTKEEWDLVRALVKTLRDDTEARLHYCFEPYSTVKHTYHTCTSILEKMT